MILDLSLDQKDHDYWEELKSILIKNNIEIENINRSVRMNIFSAFSIL